MTLTEHPNDETLQNYGLGKLEAEASTYVDHHLTVCDDCRRRAAEVSGDKFVKRMEKAVGADNTGSYLAQSAAMPAVAVPKPATEVPAELAALSEYTDVRELGRGGMGVVYLARHTLSGREEVLKVVNKGLLAADGALDRFLREIRAACALDHPNIVTAYGAQQSGDLLVLRMAYVPGHDLSKYVKQHGPLSVARACYYVYQAAQGLQYAHDQKMIHRDIKPANLMLMQQGKKHVVKVLDFGLAKSTTGAEPNPGLTGSGHAIGTPDYMAPEQFKDATSVDGRADVYALGCTLYYLLTGRAPFRGVSVIDLYLAHANTEPEPLISLRPDVPAALELVIRSMMAKAPSDRYQLPGEVTKALMPFIKPKTKTVANPFAFAEATDRETNTQRQTLSLKEAEATVRQHSRRWRWVTVGVMVTILLGLTGAFAAGILVKTKQGTIELRELASDAEVTIDGEVVHVTWQHGTKTAEVRTRPGLRVLEVKLGGVKVYGESLDIQGDGRRVVTIQLIRPKAEEATEPVPPAPPAKPDPVPEKPTGPEVNAYEVLIRNGVPTRRVVTGGDREGPYWQVQEGAYTSVGRGDRYFYFYNRKVKDFNLIAEAMYADGKGTGHVVFRTARHPDRFRGYAVSIAPSKNLARSVGSLYRYEYKSAGTEPIFSGDFAAAVVPKAWFTIELTAIGNEITSVVDGKLVGKTIDAKSQYTEGFIYLAAAQGSTIAIRSLKVRDLQPVGAAIGDGRGQVAPVGGGERKDK